MSLSLFLPAFNKANPSNRTSRKRKRSGNASSELYSTSRSTESPNGIRALPSSSRSQQLGAQHPANEQSSNLGILQKDFAPVKSCRNAENSMSVVTGDLQRNIGCAKANPVFQNRPSERDVLVRNGSRRMGFRQQHLAALTTILHKCILEGDYIRAGRTWGILLRTEVNGRFMDLRAHDRWGFGAEILCRRRSQPIESTSRQQKSFNSAEDSKKQTSFDSNQWFSSEGFEKARGYYERLILQHPYRQAFPNAVSALDFYPAMFGLWIYSEQEKYELLLKTLSEADFSIAQELKKSEHTDKSDPSGRPHTAAHLQEEDTNLAFLRRGKEIAARLGEILVSPPFSDSAGLWDLQRMVNRWNEDLSITPSPPGSKPEFRPEEGNLSTVGSD